MAAQQLISSVEIFCSYAHEDERLQQELKKHLNTLQRQGRVSFWHDRQIAPGMDWAQTIDDHLNSASLIFLLVSPDFLASDYCYNIEMRRALERHQAGEARVIPILLRPVDWQGTPIEGLQALPTDAKPITNWRNRDEAFADVAAGVRRAIEDLSLQPASQLHSPLPARWNIPYPHNPYFVGREELLSLIHLQFQEGQTTAISQSLVLSGLGGVGKTQLAVEYAYYYHQDYQTVLWARADTHEALISSYVALAELLQLPEYDALDQLSAVEAVKRWLRTHDRWLLILDNADELSIIPEFLPPVLGGHLLLTTRASAPGKLAKRVEVETFPEEQGALFLLRRAGLLAPAATFDQAATNEQIQARQISQELGGLPLALDQAGAYLEETGTSLADYLQIYQTHRVELLRLRGFIDNHPEPVATTWSLSFARVEQRSPSAAALLRLCAFFAPDAIPEEILTEGASKLGDVLASVTADPFLFNQAIEVVRAYSLVRRDPRIRTLTMHRLVQAVLRDATPAAEARGWMQRVILAVNVAFPNAEFENWFTCERCLPQALHCASWIDQKAITSLEAGRLLQQIGWYLLQRGRHAEVEPLLRYALTVSEQLLGSEHLDTSVNLNHLANLYESQGKYTEAESFYLRSLDIRGQQLGFGDPNVATALNNLARLYTKQGKLAQAETLYQRALLIAEQTLGPVDRRTAASLNNLAVLYTQQGKYMQAEPLYQRALVIWEQLEPEHPDTATSLNCLASFYVDLGKYTQAEPLYQHALAIWKKLLGEEHPDTIIGLNNLANLYEKQGKYAQAEPLWLRALSIREQQLGEGHPDTALSLNNLAYLYMGQGKYRQAEPLLHRALAIWEQLVGFEHSDTAMALENLARLYMGQGKYGQAEPLLQRALAINERHLGKMHLRTAMSLNNLAILYIKQEKYGQAEPLLQRALTIQERQVGFEHPDTAKNLNNLAVLYMNQRKYAQAEPLLQRALPIYERSLGAKHPDTLQAQKNYIFLLRLMQKDATTTYRERPVTVKFNANVKRRKRPKGRGRR